MGSVQTLSVNITNSLSYEQGDTSACTKLYVNGEEQNKIQAVGSALSYTNKSSNAVNIKIYIGAGYMFAEATVTFADGVIGQFVKETVTITYDANGGSGAPSAQTVFKGEVYGIPSSAPSRAGYYFVGWAESKTATEPKYWGNQGSIGPFPATENVTYYAVWESLEIQVTNNNRDLSACSVSADEKTLYLGTPSGGGGSQATFSLPSKATVTTRGTVGPNMSITLKVGEETKSISASSNDYQGVTGEVSYTNTSTSNIDVTITIYGYTIISTTTVTFFTGADGQFTIVRPTYTITFDANGGTGGPGSIEYNGYSLNTNFANPTREGYTFKGWSPDKDAHSSGSAPIISTSDLNTFLIYYPPSGDMTLYAVWQEN